MRASSRRCLRFRLPALALAVLLGALPSLLAAEQELAQSTRQPSKGSERIASALADGPVVVRVFYDSVEQIRDLVEFDLFEFNDREQRFVLALLDADELERVQALGFRTAVDAARTEELLRPRVPDPLQQSGIPSYPCYRTVEETYATALGLVAGRPDLATWVDIGDSWEKVTGLGGYDLRALRLTNSAIAGPKPKLVATCSIHAREYTPAELCTRFAERLLDGYGVDPDATWLLDWHEIHLVLHANPDGRKRAETGLLWRKNTNQNYCGATSNSRGADLNRNFEFEWGCCGGASSSACNELYRGPSPASEPEVQSVQSYVLSQFPDLRDDPLNSPAPPDATGVYLDIHSHGELVLWPWGFGGTAPNDVPLQTLGRKLAWFNGYTPQQAIDLYPTDGTTIDFAYGELGVASFVFELGTSFFQSCATFESAILPDNLEALLYAAKAARAPYLLPAGPDATGPSVSPVLATAGIPVVVRATLDDTRYENGNGAEPSQAIAAGEVFLDVPPWDTANGPVAHAMAADDGSFDETTEVASATIDTAGLAGGRHTVYVRGRDAAGNLGVVTAFFFYVADGSEGAIAGVVSDAVTGEPLAGSVSIEALATEVATDPATGAYEILVPPGSWTVRAAADEHLSATAPATVGSGATVVLDFALEPVPPILLVDDDDNSPDVRSYYTTALDALGAEYSIWDTANTDNEPTAFDLAPYRTVIWFTGDEFGGSAGPGNAGESALASWLDAGRCLWMSAQDYYYDRGVTSFMQSRLGLASATNDVSQTSVTGQGTPFGGFGPHTLSYPYTNYSDTLVPGAGASTAFTGNVGSAALVRDTSWYRTTFWGFGLETLPGAPVRQQAMATFLTWCGGLSQADADADGAPNGDDCSPLDPASWSLPGEARDLQLSTASADNVWWSAPADAGAASCSYDLLRGSSRDDFSTATCVATSMATTVATDATDPLPGEVLYYLVRSRNACGGTLGTTSAGAPRDGAECL